MKLSELESVLYSVRGDITFAIVWDAQKCCDIEECPVDYAIYAYGDWTVKRIYTCIEDELAHIVLSIYKEDENGKDN